VDRSGPTTASLPAEFVGDLGRRLTVAATAFAGVWIIVAIMANVTMRIVGPDPLLQYAWERFGNPLTAFAILLGVGVAWAGRRFHERPALVLYIGLGFQIVTSACVALLTYWNPVMPGRGISWLCMIILIYPAIVPAPPLLTLGASLVVASLDPLVYWLALRAGVSSPQPAFMLAWMFVPTYVSAGLAVLPAHVLRKLGREVREARELGNYRLETRLGAGGMGEVWRASHRLLARPAAVKLISPAQLSARDEGGQQLLLERFRREAAAAAALRSPHTIELYDFGVANDGTLYYAMELLEGVDLNTLVRRFGTQPPARVIHLLRQACLSLGEAHRRGLVHRDIKPSNLMVCRMGTLVDFLKVLDFGLVKVEQRTDSALTAPDVAAGTPEFMAPEAIDGVRNLDQRADLYALGCVAYWLLTGRPVFEGPSPLAILVKHSREAPAPMDGGVEPVPADLEALVFQCLEKDPDHRPGDALELERALGECADARRWTRADAERWWEENLPSETPALVGLR
jgi:serine/threonine-protein kinase